MGKSVAFDDVPDDVGEQILSHIRLYLSNPEEAHVWDARRVGGPGYVTTLLLTTTGRKSGKQRNAPLLYVNNGDKYLIIGSKGGHTDDPVWYLNLLANPECEIRVNKLHTKARARVLEGEERETAWRKVSSLHPIFLRYQSRTDRQIPVIQLEPVKG